MFFRKYAIICKIHEIQSSKKLNVTDSLFVSFPEGSVHYEFSCEIMAENPGRVLYIFRLQQRLWSR